MEDGKTTPGQSYPNRKEILFHSLPVARSDNWRSHDPIAHWKLQQSELCRPPHPCPRQNCWPVFYQRISPSRSISRHARSYSVAGNWASEGYRWSYRTNSSLIDRRIAPPAHVSKKNSGHTATCKALLPKALKRACQKLISIGSTSPRLADVEAILKTDTGNEPNNIIPIKRQPNPFLRGQESWRH